MPEPIEPIYKHGVIVNADFLIEEIIRLGRVPLQLRAKSRVLHRLLDITELRRRHGLMLRNEAIFKAHAMGKMHDEEVRSDERVG